MASKTTSSTPPAPTPITIGSVQLGIPRRGVASSPDDRVATIDSLAAGCSNICFGAGFPGAGIAGCSANETVGIGNAAAIGAMGSPDGPAL
jgi:hypothetical protein